MRISYGMYFRIVDTITLEHTSTKVVAAPIARLFATALVTASAEQRPSVCTSTGFWCHRPRVRTADRLLGTDVSLMTRLISNSYKSPGPAVRLVTSATAPPRADPG